MPSSSSIGAIAAVGAESKRCFEHRVRVLPLQFYYNKASSLIIILANIVGDRRKVNTFQEKCCHVVSPYPASTERSARSEAAPGWY